MAPPVRSPPLPAGRQGGGLDLRGPIASIFSYPTIVIFAEGEGIATAKASRGGHAGLHRRPALPALCCCGGRVRATAHPRPQALIEASPDVGGLCFDLRADVRMYYRVGFVHPPCQGSTAALAVPPLLLPLLAAQTALWPTLQAPNEASLAYRELFEEWETKRYCKVGAKEATGPG